MATIAKAVSDGKPQEEPPACAHALTKEFKLEAVRLLQLGQKPATELALELGIRRNQLYKWAEDVWASGRKRPRG